MKKLTLAMTATDLPAEGGAIWQGRASETRIISIETMLEARILQIRKEQMQWAYEIGQLKIRGDQTLQAALECGEKPSMWWTSLIYERHPKLSPNLYVIYKLRCVELLISENGYDALILKGGDRTMRNVLADLCKNAGITFNCQPGAHTSDRAQRCFARKLYELVPAPLRALGRCCHWLWSIKRKIGTATELPPLGGEPPAATIATYFPNIDMRAAGEGRYRSRYWENLHDALNAQAEKERPNGPHFVHWLFIRFPAPDLDLCKCLRLRDLFRRQGRDGLSFNYLEEFISRGDLLVSLGRWARLCLASLGLRRVFARNCRIRNSTLNFWPYMRWQWQESLAGWRCLERCLFNRAFRNYYRLAGKQRWNLFPLENCPWERMLTTAARAVPTNGQVFGAQHSTIRPTDFRYFDAPETFSAPDCAIFQPDIIAGNGGSACGQWRANGMPKARLAQVEALRYLYLCQPLPKLENKGTAMLPPPFGEPLEPGPRTRLLILTSFFADETTAHLRLAKAALDTGLLANLRLILKPHPYLMPEAWLSSLKATQRERIFVSAAPLAQELTPGTIVWASNSTTASLEAALKGLAVAVMLPDNDFDLCPIQDVSGLPRTGTLADVKRFLADPRPVKLAHDYLDLNPDLPAWKKLLDLTY